MDPASSQSQELPNINLFGGKHPVIERDNSLQFGEMIAGRWGKIIIVVDIHQDRSRKFFPDQGENFRPDQVSFGDQQ